MTLTLLAATLLIAQAKDKPTLETLTTKQLREFVRASLEDARWDAIRIKVKLGTNTLTYRKEGFVCEWNLTPLPGKVLTEADEKTVIDDVAKVLENLISQGRVNEDGDQ